MPSALNPKRIWQDWTTPTVAGDLAQRREAVLLEILATLVLLGIAAQVVQVATEVVGPRNPDFWTWGPAVTFTTLAFYGLLRRARAGHHRSSSASLIAVLSLLAFSLLATDGFSQSVWPLLNANAVLLAAILLGRKAGLTVTALHSVAVVAIATADAAGPEAWFAHEPNPNAGSAAGPVLLLALIARSCWLYTREIVTGIDEVLSHGSDASPLHQLRTKSLSVREIESCNLWPKAFQTTQSRNVCSCRPGPCSRTLRMPWARARQRIGLNSGCWRSEKAWPLSMVRACDRQARLGGKLDAVPPDGAGGSTAELVVLRLPAQLVIRCRSVDALWAV